MFDYSRPKNHHQFSTIIFIANLFEIIHRSNQLIAYGVFYTRIYVASTSRLYRGAIDVKPSRFLWIYQKIFQSLIHV